MSLLFTRLTAVTVLSNVFVTTALIGIIDAISLCNIVPALIPAWFYLECFCVSVILREFNATEYQKKTKRNQVTCNWMYFQSKPLLYLPWTMLKDLLLSLSDE